MSVKYIIFQTDPYIPIFNTRRYRQFSLPDESPLPNTKLKTNSDCDIQFSKRLSDVNKEAAAHLILPVESPFTVRIKTEKTEGDPSVSNSLNSQQSVQRGAADDDRMTTSPSSSLSEVTPKVSKMEPPACSSTPFRTPRSVKRGRRRNNHPLNPSTPKNYFHRSDNERILGKISGKSISNFVDNLVKYIITWNISRESCTTRDIVI